jgi:hypothetical protein
MGALGCDQGCGAIQRGIGRQNFAHHVFQAKLTGERVERGGRRIRAGRRLSDRCGDGPAVGDTGGGGLLRHPQGRKQQHTKHRSKHNGWKHYYSLSMPDPSVTVSWMGNPVPFQVQDNDPSSYRGLTVMQMVPLGGKRALQRDVARKDVAVEEVSRTAAQRELVATARATQVDALAGSKATVQGELNGNVLTVGSIAPAK